MAESAAPTLGNLREGLWEEAVKEYKTQQDKYEEEHQHWWKKDGKGREHVMDEIKSAKDLVSRLEYYDKDFEGMRKSHRTLLDTLVAIGIPLENMLNQASQVSGMVRTKALLQIGLLTDLTPVLHWRSNYIRGCLVLI
jgi:hypothetical protein